MNAQLERWAALHPSAPRSGKIFEIPGSYLLPRIAGILALSGLVWYTAPHFTWTKKPGTLDPAFQAEAARIGNVAQRVNGPPVFLNPIRNRISGNIVGPEDLKKAFEEE